MKDTTRPDEALNLSPDEAQLIRGLLSDERHQRAMSLIINRFCRFHMVDFFTDTDGGYRASDFVNGRRFVAKELLKYGTAEVGEQIQKVNEAKK